MSKRKKLKQDKQRLTRLAQESITIESFLSSYLGIRDNFNLSNQISHKDIKLLFPKLARTSFDYVVNNPDMIYDGDILLVEDSFGSIIPYFNPSFVFEEVEYIGEYVEEKPKEKAPNVHDLDLSSLSNYELQTLLHLYESEGLRGAYRLVHQELVHRKDSHHASRESKARTLKKERKNERFDY